MQSAASLRAQIAAKQVQIDSMRTFATTENAQLIQVQSELDGLKTQLAKLAGSGDGSGEDLIVPKGQISEAGLQYLRKLRDVKYYETIFNLLARQFETAKLDEARHGALIQVIDPAIVPDKRSFPKRTLIVLGALIGGFMLTAFWARLQEGLERARLDSTMSEKFSTLARALSSVRMI